MSEGHSSKAPTAQIDTGRLAGIAGADPSVGVFKGIPYAAAPVGQLRWRPPQPPTAWAGTRAADTFGPICPQFDPPEGSFYQQEFYLQPEQHGEDCLYLNVWTAADFGERRPVMVWFHGGAFVEGSGSLPSFHGEALARKGVVLVTVNYRLGVFGYFAHPALSAESEHHASGNYGLLDQVAALEWVQRNIAAFGGDPDNVTIFGQSAGSMSVFALLVSPLARGLFRRAIGQSGSPFSFRNTKTLRQAEQTGAALAEAWGAADAHKLRALPAQALIGTRDDYRGPGYGPIDDGWALPGDPASLMAAGQFHPVSLMVGATADEGSSLVGGFPIDVASYRSSAAQRFGAGAEAFLRLYPADSDTSALRGQIASMSDQLFAGMQVWAGFYNQSSRNPAHVYYFDRRLPGRNSDFYGAFHSSELFYVFGTLDSTDRPWEAADRQLTDAMTSYWANFAATGDPNGAGLPDWPAYDAAGGQVLLLGDRIAAGPAPKPASFEFFEREIERWLARDS